MEHNTLLEHLDDSYADGYNEAIKDIINVIFYRYEKLSSEFKLLPSVNASDKKIQIMKSQKELEDIISEVKQLKFNK